MSNHEENERLEETEETEKIEIMDENEETPLHVDEISPEEFREIQAALEATQLEAAENLDGWQRAKAEFINYKKRVEREQAKMYDAAAARVIKRYLDVLDDLDRAMADRPQEGSGAEWAGGIEHIHRKLSNILENEGVVVMEVEGQEFDPNLHEAIAMEESADHKSGEIIEIIKNGYLIGDRVLRPATVRVAS